ncbi:MAG: hypothetical protein HYZ85_01510 [Candidatus Omnitrophica bacterium]|nr:hypothetical protein [Candidatus Omnitrophota bacterium]
MLFFFKKVSARTLFALTLISFIPPAYAIKYSQKTYQRKLKETQIAAELYSFMAGIFSVRLEEKPASTVERGLIRVIEKTISSHEAHFGFTPAQAAELILLEGNTYDSIDDPEIASGGFYANKKIRMKIDLSKPESQLLGDFEKVFRHEYSHLVIASIGGGKVPRWLDEGLATYLEKDATSRIRGEGRKFYQDHTKAGTLVPIEKFVKMDLNIQYRANIGDFYKQSYLYAKYLIDRYGFLKFRELLSALKEGSMNFTHAFPQVYGINLAQLEAGAYDS